MVTSIRTLIARAVVRVAILAAPPDMADALRAAVRGGGGPRPTLPQ